MQNLTLKNHANEDVVFTAVSSGTATTPAAWVNTTDPAILSQVIQVSGRFNGQKTAQKVRITLNVPGANDLCEGSCEIHNIPVVIDITLPMVMSNESRADVAAYLKSLLASAVVQTAITTGYSPS